MDKVQNKKMFAKKYRIASARLQGFDYASGGVYFITICTKDKRDFFGTIQDREMRLSTMGRMVASEWERTPTIRENVTLGAWVVMPNHFHAIVIIQNRRNDTHGNTETHGNVETHGNASLRDAGGKIVLEKEVYGNVGGIVETHGNASLRGDGKYKNAFGPQSGNVSAIIRGFKGATTKQIHVAGFSDFTWQSRFYDRIVRNEEEWRRIEEYIVSNPKTWETDCNFSKS